MCNKHKFGLICYFVIINQKNVQENTLIKNLIALTWNFLTVLQLENYFASLKNPKLRVSFCSSLVPCLSIYDDFFSLHINKWRLNFRKNKRQLGVDSRKIQRTVKAIAAHQRNLKNKLRYFRFNIDANLLCHHLCRYVIMTPLLNVFQQDSCGEEERPSLVALVKPSPKPRRARLLSKGRKLNNRKRGRPKKVTPAVEKKNQKNQSALDLLHAKTLSAAPPQGQHIHTHSSSP